MKKLSLKKLKLESADLLQRNELKTVLGGYGGGTATAYCKKTGNILLGEESVDDCKRETVKKACKDYADFSITASSCSPN